LIAQRQWPGQLQCLVGQRLSTSDTESFRAQKHKGANNVQNREANNDRGLHSLIVEGQACGEHRRNHGGEDAPRVQQWMPEQEYGRQDHCSEIRDVHGEEAYPNLGKVVSP
jgi:hypothetical protein